MEILAPLSILLRIILWNLSYTTYRLIFCLTLCLASTRFHSEGFASCAHLRSYCPRVPKCLLSKQQRQRFRFLLCMPEAFQVELHFSKPWTKVLRKSRHHSFTTEELHNSFNNNRNCFHYCTCSDSMRTSGRQQRLTSSKSKNTTVEKIDTWRTHMCH